jgi:hypothetical protein
MFELRLGELRCWGTGVPIDMFDFDDLWWLPGVLADVHRHVHPLVQIGQPGEVEITSRLFVEEVEVGIGELIPFKHVFPEVAIDILAL